MSVEILLVEDNLLTARGLQYLLEREKYRVDNAPDAKTAREFALKTYDLILLDVSLPDSNGFELAQFLKNTQPSTPIIFLTAKDEAHNIIHGLELGADDYIIKPFHNRELLLRIQNVLRRFNKGTKLVKFDNLELDVDQSIVKVDGRIVDLTALEYKIFTTLLEQAEKIVPREKILDEIWAASGRVVNDNTVSVYVKRLRQKIGTDHIQTVKCLGYRLVKTNAKSERTE